MAPNAATPRGDRRPVLLIGLALVLCAWGLMWGLPYSFDPAQDSVVPNGQLAEMGASFEQVTAHRYPPFHFMLLRAAWEIDQGRDARDWISMVKVEAAETLGRVADRAVQIFGGMGYCRELPVERLYRDARIYRIFDGTSEIHRTVIARGALRRGAAAWDIGA